MSLPMKPTSSLVEWREARSIIVCIENTKLYVSEWKQCQLALKGYLLLSLAISLLWSAVSPCSIEKKRQS